MLRMMIKSIRGIDIPTAYKETLRKGSAKLRKLVMEEANKKLGVTHVVIRKLQALLDRGEELTEDRNLLIHSIVAQPLDSDEILLRDEDLNWLKPPTAAEVKALADEVLRVINELNEFRLLGELRDALVGVKP